MVSVSVLVSASIKSTNDCTANHCIQWADKKYASLLNSVPFQLPTTRCCEKIAFENDLIIFGSQYDYLYHKYVSVNHEIRSTITLPRANH